ncbi:hypothetical protein ACRALDRAFT_212747 [Sodiomyces alcalophilus JCM 7366]|uniref:uncharacterized protein n=1 Tax=Sodiomyces alcalophilus JCM 7366 TaxID=591952 RepID=UPI0039B5A3FF
MYLLSVPYIHFISSTDISNFIYYQDWTSYEGSYIDGMIYLLSVRALYASV